ncbi:hypothetical protein [Aeromonas sp. Y311-2]|uniref:hypothetical protein n=1 Tax=Aeromonas sp. Y311-2 TaxID=2990507 RepID=UPI0022E3827F|nr:hypothetical protein [Aeromonas sp. Y311-2]
MKFLKVLFKSLITFPFVVLFWHTPSMMRAAIPVGAELIHYLLGLMTNIMFFRYIDDIGWIQNENTWPYVGLFFVVLFVITFMQTAKHMEQDEEYDARCAAERLEKQQNNPWGPYFGQPVDAASVNIELTNGKILWRVPACKLEELAEDVKLWMPTKPRT